MIDNKYLEDAAGSIDLAGRLQQLFLDADDLFSDINGQLGASLMDLEDATPAEEAKIAQAVEVLRAARTKVYNIVYDFKVHYVLSAKDQRQAELEGLVHAAENYKLTPKS